MTRPVDVVTGVGKPVNIESADFDVDFFTIHTLSVVKVNFYSFIIKIYV